MKLIFSAIALLIAAPAFAGDYVDSNGCTHIDMGGYYNLGHEAGCNRGGAEGGWWVDAERLAPDCDDK